MRKFLIFKDRHGRRWVCGKTLKICSALSKRDARAFGTMTNFVEVISNDKIRSR